MAKLFGSSAISTVEEPNFCPAALREIKITTLALEKIYALAEIVVDIAKRGYEAYCLLLGNEEGLVEDILIPEQEVSSYSVEISKGALLKTIEELTALESHLQVLGWAHSHAYMSAFSSSTDDENHITILNQSNNIRTINEKKTKYAYGLTVSLLPRDHYGVVASQFECGALVLREASLTVINQEPEDVLDTEIIKAEVKEEILKKVKVIVPKPPKLKWSDRVKSWFKKDQSEDLFPATSLEEDLEDFVGLSSFFEEESLLQWPEELKGSHLIDLILSNPTLKDYIAELCDQWRLSVGEDTLQHKLEDIIEIAVLETINQIKDTLKRCIREKSEEEDASKEEWNVFRRYQV